jgi:hypothetical protein
MGSFNRQFTEYSKDNFISAEELQKLGRGFKTIYQTGSVKNGNQGTETRLSDEKGFWKKFKKNYKKKGGEKLGIAGIAGKPDKESLTKAYSNPKYGPPVAEKEKKEKEDNKYKGSIKLLSEKELEGTLYKPERIDTSDIDKRYGLGKIQAEVDEIKANALPSPTLNFKKGLLKGIGSTAPKLEGLNKATNKANKSLTRLMDKASKFDSNMTFDMIPDKIQKKITLQSEKLGPSGQNYKPIKNKDSAFEDVLPKPAFTERPFAFPSTTKAEGVTLTKEQAEKNFNPIKAAKQFSKEKEKNFNPIKAAKQFSKEKEKTSFKDVLPKPAKKGSFGVPSTSKAKGVFLKKNKKK